MKCFLTIASLLLSFGVAQAGSPSTSEFGEIKQIASAQGTDEILEFLTSSSGAINQNSAQLKDPNCLVDNYPKVLSVYNSLGYQLKRVKLSTTEFFYDAGSMMGTRWRERLTLYFYFDKNSPNGTLDSKSTQINCVTGRTRSEDGNY